MNRKKIIILAIILGIFLVSIIAIVSLNSKKNNGVATNSEPSENTQQNDSASSGSGTYNQPSPTDKTISIKTPNGTVDIDNIYKNPAASLSLGGVSFQDTDNYDEAYYPQDQVFLIVITDSNIQEGRQQAESQFLQALNISKNQACLLKVNLSVPESISEAAAGKNYGLSFCPNGKAFPN